MEIGAITGYVDVAQVVLYVFWVFFFGLIYYLHSENKREGYPLETDHLDPARRKKILGLTHLPSPKVFRIADGSTVLAPDPARADHRPLKAVATAKTGGSTIMPTVDPMLAEVGPGSYAERANTPDMTYDHKPKIVPMRIATDFHVEERDPDPRGMTVVGTDGGAAGTITDIWVDRGEFVARLGPEVPLTYLGSSAVSRLRRSLSFWSAASLPAAASLASRAFSRWKSPVSKARRPCCRLPW